MTDSNRERGRRKGSSWLLLAWRAIAFTIGLVLLVDGALLALAERVAPASLCLASGVVLLALSIFDRFEVIKGAGLEFKLRDILRRAEVSIEEMHSLAEFNVHSMLDMAARNDLRKYSDVGRAALVLEGAEQAMNAKRSLISMGFDAKMVRRTLSPWLGAYARHSQRVALNDFGLAESMRLGGPRPADEVAAKASGRTSAEEAAARRELTHGGYWNELNTLRESGIAQAIAGGIDGAIANLRTIQAVSRGVDGETGKLAHELLSPCVDRMQRVSDAMELDDEALNYWRDRLPRR